MTSSKPITWGIIGASDIAATRMIPAMRRVGDSVATLASNDSDHASGYAQRHGISRYGETEEVLSDPSVDAVYISSRNEHHSAQAIAAAMAGKHILCEKPVATNLQEALAMVQACRASGVVLAVNHHLPAAGTHAAIRELVGAGAVGRPLTVTVRHATLLPERLRGWRLRQGAGAGVVMDLSCHNASVINSLLGTRPIDVMARALTQGPWSSGAEDTCSATIRYDGDVLVDFQDSFTHPYTDSYMEVNGEEGRIRGHNIMTPEPIGSVFLTDRDGSREVPVPDRRHTYDITLERFRSAVREGARPVVDGVDAVNTLAVSLAILESARSGRICPIETTPS